MKKNLFAVICISLLLSGCGNGKDIDYNKTDTVTFYNLTFEIPTIFTFNSADSQDDIKFYSYEDSKKYNSCKLYVAVSNYPNTDLKKVVQNGLLGETNFSYNEKNINGYTWSIGYVEKSAKRNHTFYAINNNGKQYSISYDDFGSGEKCAEALKIIDKSLKFN